MKSQNLLVDIVGIWYINNTGYKPPLLESPILSKEKHTKNYKKDRLRKPNGNWNDWKSQVLWNKTEWVGSNMSNQKINLFSTSSFKNDNV